MTVFRPSFPPDIWISTRMPSRGPTGGAANASSRPINGATDAAVGDFNADGDSDLAVADYTGVVSVLLNSRVSLDPGSLAFPPTVAGGGSEHVASGEGGPGRGEPVVGVVERDHRTGPTGHGHRRGEQTVVGTEEHAPGHLYAHQTAAGADARVDDRQVHARSAERQRTAQDEGSGPDVVAVEAVGEVDDPRLGRDSRDHRAADPGELVARAVVRQEGDRSRHAAQRLIDCIPSGA